MTTAFDKSNLEAGLMTFVKLPLMQKRYNAAMAHYEAQLAKNVAPQKAIDATLVEAVKGLKNEKDQLQKARKAAGVNPMSANMQQATSKIPIPIKTPRTVKSTTSVTTDKKKRTIAPILIGLGIGAILGMIVGLAISAVLVWIYQSLIADFKLEDLVYWLSLIATVVAFAALGWLIGTRYILRESSSVESTHESTSKVVHKTA